jgi:hypothetical protein
MDARLTTSTKRSLSALKATALVTAALLAAALLSAAGLNAAPAHADGGGATVNVSVTADAEAVNGVNVDLYQVEGTGSSTQYSYQTVNSTDSDGVASFPDLSPGGRYVYEVEAPTDSSNFSDGDLNPTDYAQTWGGATTAYTPQEAGGAIASDGDIAIALLPAFSISGAVTNSDGSTTGFQWAQAYRVDAGNPNGSFVQESYAYGGDGDGDGTYRIDGLRPGTYKIQYTENDNGVSGYTWTGNKSDAADASTVTITDTSLTGINATLPVGHTISGTLKAPDGTLANDGQRWVRLFEADGTTVAADDSVVQSDGKFTFVGVPAGSYKLLLNTPENGEYSDWYSDQADASTATPVVVDDNPLDDPTNLTAQLSGGVTVSGTVRDSSDVPEQDVQVSALTAGGQTVSDGNGGFADHFDTTTNSNGFYSLTLPPANFVYKVSSDDMSFNDQYAKGSTTTYDQSSASQTSYAVGTHTQNITLQAIPTLTVHVANKAGKSLGGVDVTAEAVTDGADTPGLDQIEANPVAGHSGTYTLAGLQPDQDYALYFNPSGSSLTGTYPQYLGGAVDLQNAQVYHSDGGSGSLDVTLASNASVSGVVTNSAGKGIKNAFIVLNKFDGANWNETDYAISSSSGAYSFPNEATGSYTVEFFTAAPYVSTFAGGASDAASATHVYVAPGKPAVLNAKLTTGGSISGVVSGPTGSAKLANIGIETIALQGTPGHFTSATPVLQSPFFSGGDTTDTSGKFTESSLATGYYALSFFDESGDDIYGDTFDNPVTNPLSHTTIYHVTAGKATAAGTVRLPLRSTTATATFSGSLDTSADPDIQPDGYVYFYKSDGTYVDTAAIQPDGTFSIMLEPGTYTYVATVVDDNDDYATFADETGTVSTGDAPISIPVEFESPLAFSPDPTAMPSSSTEVGTTYALNSVSANWPSIDYSVSYQWFRDNTPIYGAMNATYTSQGTDLGADLRVRVRLTDYNGNTASEYVDVVPEVTESDQLFSTGDPTSSTDASGQLAVGQTAHSAPGQWNGLSGLSYSYKWVDNSASTTVGTAATFTPTASQIGHSIQLEVGASKLGYTTPDYQFDENTFTVVSITPPALKTAPKVTSKTVGTVITYTVTPGTWSVAGTSPSYEWALDGVVDTGVTGASYAYNTSAHPVHSQPSLTVKVKADKSGYAQASASTIVVRKDDSAFVAPFGATDSVSGSISASTDPVYVGEVLRPDTSGAQYASDNTVPTGFTYQWQRSTSSLTTFANIAGATKSSYTVTTADLGHRIDLVLTGSSALHSATIQFQSAGTATPHPDLVNDAFGAHAGVDSDTWEPGTKLVSSGIPWSSVASVTNSYQWLVCSTSCTDPTSAAQFTAIKGATASTYTPPLTLANRYIALRVTGSKTGYTSATVYSTAQQLGDGKTIIALTPPTIASGLVGGNAKIGAKLTVKPGTYNVAGVTPTYVWQASQNLSDWTTVGTGATYTVNGFDFMNSEKGIRVVESATKSGGYSEPVGATNPSAAASFALTVPTPKVAPKVTSVGGNWVVTGSTWSSGPGSTYDWIVDGADSGVTTSSLAQSGTTGKAVSVVVSAGDAPGYSPASVTVVAQKGAAPAWASPTVGGSTNYGGTLTTVTDPTDAFSFAAPTPGAALTYQWYSASTASGTPVAISKATGKTFTPSTAYINKWISVKLTVTSSNYATASHLTAAVQFTAGAPLNLGVSMSSSSLHPGSKVSAVLTGVSPLSGQTHTYEWELSSDGGNTFTTISGATKSSYTVLAGDLGKSLVVIVKTTKTGYVTAFDGSEVEQIHQATILQPTTQPSLTGNAAAGSTLTVSPGVWNVASTFTYQWYRDGVIIPGATATTYTTTGDEDGENVSVRVTARSSGYVSVTVSPADILVTDGAAPSVVTAPKVTGTASAGSTLTATSGVWSLDDLTITYQWVGSVSGPIMGATASTYTLTDDQSGQSVWVIVTVSRAGYTSKSAQSNSLVVPSALS